MKKSLLTLALLAVSTSAWAQRAGELGAGLVLGDPIGGTAKVWLDDKLAVDFGLGGSDGDFAAWADMLVHGWSILPQPKEGKLGLYGAVGGRVADRDETQFGLRTMGGVSYWVGEHPIELFAELGPVFELSGDTGVDINGGLGVRFYFAGVKK